MISSMWIPCAVGLSFAMGIAMEAARASTGAKKQPRVTGIGGIFFKAQNPGKLAQWYREHLGIAVDSTSAEEDAARYHSFEWREKDHPDRAGLTVWSIFPEQTTYFESSRAPFMINYRVVNLDQLLMQLRQAGVTVDDKIDEEANGRFGWVTDPEGNRIELWEPQED